MKSRLFVTALIAAVILGVTPPALAAGVTNKTGAKLAIINLQKSIAKSTTDLRNLGENSIVGNSKTAIKYAKLLQPLTQRWLIDKKAAEDKISTSLTDLNRKSNFIVLWDNFVGCNVKQDPCKKGAVYNIPFDVKNEVIQSGFDRNVVIGVIAPQDKLGYDKAREVYKFALEDLPRINRVYEDADFALRGQIFDEYDAEEERLRANLNTQKLALAAAKRASLASRDFEGNFKTAFYFQHNLDSLFQVGSASFSQIESYLDALNVVSASQAYALGVGISRNYQASKAAAFNKSLGNAFTNDSEFRSIYNRALSLYRSHSKKMPSSTPILPTVVATKPNFSIFAIPFYNVSFTGQVVTATVVIPAGIKDPPNNVIGIKLRLFQGDVSLLTKDTIQELGGNENTVNVTYDLSGLWSVIKSRNLPLRFQVEYYGSAGSGESVLKEISLP